MSDEELITRYIELDPNRPGLDRARLKEFGVPVWALIGYLKHAVHDDSAQVAADYGVPVDAVEAAIAFYRRHPAVIDARIAANAGESLDLLTAA